MGGACHLSGCSLVESTLASRCIGVYVGLSLVKGVGVHCVHAAGAGWVSLSGVCIYTLYRLFDIVMSAVFILIYLSILSVFRIRVF